MNRVMASASACGVWYSATRRRASTSGSSSQRRMKSTAVAAWRPVRASRACRPAKTTAPIALSSPSALTAVAIAVTCSAQFGMGRLPSLILLLAPGRLAGPLHLARFRGVAGFWGHGGRLPGVSRSLRVQEGGGGEPVLVLLHGLGATGDVWNGWRPLLARRWPGRWLAPDLPGHGGSPPLSEYTFGGLAEALAGLGASGSPAVVLGHSLGGAVGLALAGDGFAVRVQAVIGLGIKVVWADDELQRAQAVARRPTAWY